MKFGQRSKLDRIKREVKYKKLFQLNKLFLNLLLIILLTIYKSIITLLSQMTTSTQQAIPTDNQHFQTAQTFTVPQFKQQPYRFVICLLFAFINFINGMSWVVVTPISKGISQAYNQSSVIVSLIPMSYLISYVIFNFPSNWVLDVKGIKPGIIIGSVFTALGTGIRCFVNLSFSSVIIGQFLCAIAQPFILNSTTKIATRWFTPQNRSLALAILSVINIVGTAVGFVIPPAFVNTDTYGSEQAVESIRNDFWGLLMCQFGLALGATLLNIFLFRQRPIELPSMAAMAEHVQFKESIKILFTQKKFLGLSFAFATVLGAFNTYGSLLEQILDPYGISSDQTSILAASMMIVGIISAALIGIYIEKTLNYRKVFAILAVLGIAQTIGLLLALKYASEFYILQIIIIIQGILMIPMLPLCCDYGCDIMFPIGEAQITGTLMTWGQIFGILFIVVAQNGFGLGDNEKNQKDAAFNTAVFVGAFLLVGSIAFMFFNGELKRTAAQRVEKAETSGIGKQEGQKKEEQRKEDKGQIKQDKKEKDEGERQIKQMKQIENGDNKEVDRK